MEESKRLIKLINYREAGEASPTPKKTISRFVIEFRVLSRACMDRKGYG
tara:strand:+ start:1109 stop:1255 length:147 start_codon:yes stop_codon:yes gene_type:complete